MLHGSSSGNEYILLTGIDLLATWHINSTAVIGALGRQQYTASFSIANNTAASVFQSGQY